jgi:hypothetical protein
MFTTSKLSRYTPEEYARKVREMSPECKVRRNVRQKAERLKAIREYDYTQVLVGRPFDWEREDQVGNDFACGLSEMHAHLNRGGAGI